MITATQIRGARAMIGMSIEELAAASGLPVETVRALENGE
ncbi:multiprotein-bridging factor 1 family protein, partial [Rhizobium ruizarguesonis]